MNTTLDLQTKRSALNIYNSRIYAIDDINKSSLLNFGDLIRGKTYLVKGDNLLPKSYKNEIISSEFEGELVYVGDSWFKSASDDEYYQILEFSLLGISDMPTIYTISDSFLEFTDFDYTKDGQSFGIPLESVKGFFDIGCKFKNCILAGCTNSPSKSLYKNNIFQLIGSQPNLHDIIGDELPEVNTVIQVAISTLHYIHEIDENLYIIKFDSTNNVTNKFAFVEDIYGFSLKNKELQKSLTKLAESVNSIINSKSNKK